MSRDRIIKTARDREEPEWLVERRCARWDESERAATPDFKYGLGVSLPASRIRLPEGEPTAVPVSVSGARDLKLEPLAAALAEAPVFDAWLSFGEMGDDRPTAVAAWQEAWGVGERLLRVPSGWSADEPIRVEMRSSGLASHRLLVDVGESSRITLVASSSAEGLQAGQVEVFVRPGAAVNLICVSDGPGTVFENHRFHLAAGAHLDFSLIQCAGVFSAHSSRARLAGSGAAFCYRSAFVGGAGSLFDEACLVAHASPDTHCDLKSAAVMGRADKAFSRALLSLEPGVTDATAKQRSDALLLSEGAEFAAWPEFSARHDRIRCAHGGAVTGLNQERFFYLMSRGLGRSAAAAVLAESFLAPQLVKLRDAGLNEEIEDIIGSISSRLIYADR
jgi:Fe-S cluster assembly scaffold protein SufB